MIKFDHMNGGPSPSAAELRDLETGWRVPEPQYRAVAAPRGHRKRCVSLFRRCYSGFDFPLTAPLSRQAGIFGEGAGAVESVKVVAPRPAHPAPAQPPPPLPWWILRPTGLGAAIWVLTPTETAIDDCRALPGGCTFGSGEEDQPLQPPYMTPIDPRSLAREQCHERCWEAAQRRARPGSERFQQYRRCMRACMAEEGFEDW